METLPENDRVRYTISPKARREVLKRLLNENLARSENQSKNAGGKQMRSTKKIESTTNLPELY
ncbi:MAG: hypothetical protein OXF06_01545 [Bacteroidetes bacterium]|nr:hypothetical protein [Bacteroidota bacterium]